MGPDYRNEALETSVLYTKYSIGNLIGCEMNLTNMLIYFNLSRVNEEEGYKVSKCWSWSQYSIKTLKSLIIDSYKIKNIEYEQACFILIAIIDIDTTYFTILTPVLTAKIA
ncbi:hypothetical protein F4703DRAFT_1919087 [Phycomyces blakesleeanus]|uniref:Uncharacterized protein n=1 Tax=Phycomyces blakesleeanus (strain ATCC 8743b / DSM 1359 / FGSC 10004 / NBRC 33097 / NRRL 1555) TaxID=763407 RepID=A0A167L4K3_PHYB8|nr:hypothetical protein PHYBLDRAFT_172222 [Phycomyces blakesleeanus NRRL 1555(-)]OAD69585.1 hypothetical protein PHYBLDRAFT_172222 [Phycomyces blakesleeanus NRRL 1555(-)]|eukprot:XP_018287625.1 hypothetical protein PHYBLDRAFT_172222 [Phycomyces blakesleeanus NRRL 1555(-)]